MLRKHASVVLLTKLTLSKVSSDFLNSSDEAWHYVSRSHPVKRVDLLLADVVYSYAAKPLDVLVLLCYIDGLLHLAEVFHQHNLLS